MEYPSLDTAKAGAIRFNTDSNQMEIYDGNQWVIIVGDSPILHTGGTRGLFYSGGDPADDVIQYVNVASTGNAVDFGDLAGDLGSQTGYGGQSNGHGGL